MFIIITQKQSPASKDSYPFHFSLDWRYDTWFLHYLNPKFESGLDISWKGSSKLIYAAISAWKREFCWSQSYWRDMAMKSLLRGCVVQLLLRLQVKAFVNNPLQFDDILSTVYVHSQFNQFLLIRDSFIVMNFKFGLNIFILHIVKESVR